ncbi:MAG TPA: NB-ARC domain-containing protein [Thermosynechococcaceae cyanobacterium]
MANSVKASIAGLAIVDQARQRRGWTKTSTARWWQDSHTSRATLRRFWQGDRIQQEIFIALCQTVGIEHWEKIAAADDFTPPTTTAQLDTAQLDWDEAPDVECFFGRSQELQQLEQWLVSDRRPVVAIDGMAGIGKTALALSLTERLQAEFEGFVWRSLHPTTDLLSLLNSLLGLFDQSAAEMRSGTAELIRQLNQRRRLLVLDGLEAAQVQEPNLTAAFLKQLSRGVHQSRILITSNLANPIDEATISRLSLKGLQQADALELLRSQGFTGKEPGLAALIRLYHGNPLALRLVSPLIQSVFGGSVTDLLNQNTLVVGDRLHALLQRQICLLSVLEREILYWLAIWQEPISFCRLQTHLLIPVSPTALLESITLLERRSLLEKWVGAEQPSFTLQPLVMKVVTDELLEHVGREIAQVALSHDIQQFVLLRTHRLLRPGTDDIAGDRILNQLRERLWQIHGAALPQILEQILLLLQNRPPLAIGYIGCNLASLAIL